MAKIIDLRQERMKKATLEKKVEILQGLEPGRFIPVTGTYNDDGADERLKRREEELKAGLEAKGENLTIYDFRIEIIGNFKNLIAYRKK